MSEKLEQAIANGGDDPRLRKVRREFKAVFGFRPDLDTEPQNGWYTGEGSQWSVDLEGTLLVMTKGGGQQITSIEDYVNKVVAQ